MNNITSEVPGEYFRQPVAQAWVEYDKGFSELCPQSQISQTGRKKCSQRARQRLRNWLNKEAETCLKTEIPKDFPTTTRSCRPAANAVFTYIVSYRERIKKAKIGFSDVQQLPLL